MSFGQPATVTSSVVKRRALPCVFSFTSPGTGAGAIQAQASSLLDDNVRTLNFMPDQQIQNNNTLSDAIVSRPLGMPPAFRPMGSRYFTAPILRSSLAVAPSDVALETVVVEVTPLGGIVVRRQAAASQFQPLETITFLEAAGQFVQ